MKPSSFQSVYADYYRQLIENMPTNGPLLEIGAGSRGGFDTDRVQYIDLFSECFELGADASEPLPFEDESFGGVILLDTIHKLPNVVWFFSEVARILRPGGRIALIEPGITPLSWALYRYLYALPTDMNENPVSRIHIERVDRSTWTNTALPTLLFRHQEHRIALNEAVPSLRVMDRQWISLFAYPLARGVKSWPLVPNSLIQPLLRLESHLQPALGALIGFRLKVTLQKRDG